MSYQQISDRSGHNNVSNMICLFWSCEVMLTQEAYLVFSCQQIFIFRLVTPSRSNTKLMQSFDITSM